MWCVNVPFSHDGGYEVVPYRMTRVRYECWHDQNNAFPLERAGRCRARLVTFLDPEPRRVAKLSFNALRRSSTLIQKRAGRGTEGS